MHISRREFISFLGALGLAGCARRMPRLGLHRSSGFTFATINDLHVLDMRSTAIVNRAVEQINEDDQILFTVVLGDLATSGTYAELRLAKGSLDRLNRPCLVVPGNHDVNMSAPNIFGNYEGAFGDTNWKEDKEGWVFLGLNSCEQDKSDVTIPPDRIEWLEHRLRKVNAGRPLALFTHHPLNPGTKAYRIANAEEVLGLFAGHNLKLVASGHYHGNQVEQRDGVLFTTTACCSSTRDNFDGTEAKGFRLFHVEKDAVETEFVQVVR